MASNIVSIIAEDALGSLSTQNRLRHVATTHQFQTPSTANILPSTAPLSMKYAASNYINVMTITGSNVGIGTVTPASTLHIVGSYSNILTTSNVPTSYLPTTSNLTTWYTFDGGSLADKSGNGYTLAATGTAKYTANAKVGSTAVYLANEATVNVASRAVNYLTNASYTMSTTPTYSVACWVNFNTLTINSGNTSVLWCFGTTAAFNSYFYNTNNTTIGFNDGNTAAYVLSSLTTGAWNHFAVTRQSGGSNVLYVNGSPVAYGAASVSTTAGTALQLGESIITGQTSSFAGYIDDFRVYNRVLSPTEVANIYSTATNSVAATPYVAASNLSSNLITLLPFDYSSTLDVSSNVYSSLFTGSSGTNFAYAPGRVGTYCLQLTNTMGASHTTQLDLTPPTNLYNTSTISVAFWVMTSSAVTTGFPYVFNIGTIAAATNLGIAMYSPASTNSFSVAMTTTGTAFTAVGSTFTLTPGQWYHIGVTYNGATALVYVNGAQSQTGAFTGALNYYATLRIGDSLNTTISGAFAGFIDDFRVYNRVLTPTEILTLYQTPQNQVAPSTGVLGWWQMEGNLLDSSGSSNAGTASGSTPANATFVGGKVGSYALNLANAAAPTSTVYVDIPMSLQQTGVTPYSLSLWFNPTTLPTSGNSYIASFVSTSAASSTRAAELYVTSAGALTMNSYDMAANTNDTTLATISYGSWQHVAMTWGDGSMRAYLNGSNVINKTMVGGQDSSVYTKLRLGDLATTTGSAFNGAIDEVRLYNHILTQKEITSLYSNSNMTIVTPTQTNALQVVGPAVMSGTLQVTNTTSSAGRALWAARVTGAGTDSPASVTVTSDGGFAVYGTTTSSTMSIVNADGSLSNLTLSLVGTSMGFLVKYSAAGFATWAAKIGATVANVYTSVYGTNYVCSPTDGSIVVLGQYSFGPLYNTNGPLICYNADGSQFSTTLPWNASTGATAGTFNSFVVKYNINGVVQWATRGLFDYPTGIQALLDGGIAIAGIYYQSNPIMYSTNGTSATTSRISTANEVFLIKLTTAGVVSWWARVSSSSYTQSTGLTQLTGGNIVVTGNYYAQCFSYAGTSSGPSASPFGTSITYTYTQDAFIMQFDNTGNPVWVNRLTSQAQSTGCSPVATIDGGFVVTAFYGTYANVYNAPGGTIANLFANIPSTGSTDTAIVKYNSVGAAQWVSRVTNTVFPNYSRQPISSTTDGGIIIGGCLTPGSTSIVYNSDGTFTFSLIPLSTGTAASYIAKISSTGICQWATKINGGTYDAFSGLVVTPDNGVIVVGATGSASVPILNADGTTHMTLPGTTGGYDGFLIKYNDIGTLTQQGLNVMTNGYVGIGVAAPLSVLHTVGSVSMMNGNVGIGTTNPANTLSVNGTSYVSSYVGIGTTTTITSGSLLDIYTTGTTGAYFNMFAPNISAGNVSVLQFGSQSSFYNCGQLFFTKVGVSSQANYLTLGLNGVPNALYANGYGSIGIGVTNPTNTLSVNGTGNITGNATVGGALNITGTSGTPFVVNPSSGSSYTAQFLATSMGTGAGSINLQIGRTQGTNYDLFALAYTQISSGNPQNYLGFNYWGSGGIYPLVITGYGNVGIGLTNPSSTLHVSGTGNISGALTAAGGINSVSGAVSGSGTTASFSLTFPTNTYGGGMAVVSIVGGTAGNNQNNFWMGVLCMSVHTCTSTAWYTGLTSISSITWSSGNTFTVNVTNSYGSGSGWTYLYTATFMNAL